MSNNKQTAVDYIDKAIDKYLAYSVEGSHKAEPFTITDLRIAVEQAKEMEKHQQDKFTNAPIHDKKAIIEMMNKLHPKEMAEVVEFIKIKIETYGKQ